MKRPIYADDATEQVSLLVRLRIPYLALGLLLGLFLTQITSKFETLLNSHVSLAFFIPVIVYMSDAVGTQTETIYVRNLAKRQIKFMTYLTKELLVGLLIGLLFGLAVGIFALLWLEDTKVALSVGLAMLVSVATAPIVALLISGLLHNEHTDPAVSAGPFATVLQDLISLLIYFSIASLIIF